eukprot:229986-Pyramimonas_sp.AAC.1
MFCIHRKALSAYAIKQRLCVRRRHVRGGGGANRQQQWLKATAASGRRQRNTPLVDHGNDAHGKTVSLAVGGKVCWP